MHNDRPHILIVDDTEANVDLLDEVLHSNFELSVAMNGEDALNAAQNAPPDLILLDIMMPSMDGFEVCRRLKADPKTHKIPIIFITARNETVDEAKGFTVGAVDYILKPISPPIVLARIRTHLALADQQKTCEKVIDKQVREIRQGQKDAIYMLGLAGHYNDDDTGAHIWRMANYAKILAKAVGWSVEQQNMLLLAAPMHDTGKIGIPDGILRKPGKLDEDEWAIMRKHTTYGHRILSVAKTPLFSLASDIALCHHEKWDGSGYPAGLSGHDISEAARIVAIADVFDALTMQRPYKAPWTFERAMDYIQNSNGHFEPRLANAFITLKKEIVAIKRSWGRREKNKTL